MPAERCRHDMLIGTCAMCATTAAEPRHGDLILIYDPANRKEHRVHEEGCPDVEAQHGEELWPRERITREQATGMIPCGHCQPLIRNPAPRSR